MCTCAVARPLTPVFTRQHSGPIAHQPASSWPFSFCGMTSPHVRLSALFNCVNITVRTLENV